MHPNPAFRTTERARNIAFARDRAFGILSINGPAGPLMAHVPFELSDDGSRARLHLVRSNPILRALDAPLPAVIAVSGPDGYISPDWYGLPDQVPTWNYVAVHLRGLLHPAPDTVLRGTLDDLSAQMENRMAEAKRPWTADKMSQGVMDRMMRQIGPCTLHVDTIDGTWKLNQNKPAEARLRAAEAVAHSNPSLAALMRDATDPA